jgi:hypothetical protein
MLAFVNNIGFWPICYLMNTFSSASVVTCIVGGRNILSASMKRLRVFAGFFLQFFILAMALSACTEQAAETNSSKVTAADDLELSSSMVYLSEVNGQYAVSATFVDANGVA